VDRAAVGDPEQARPLIGVDEIALGIEGGDHRHRQAGTGPGLLDGTHARVHGRASRFGAYLDIVLDFVVYAAIPMAIAWRHGTLSVAFAALALVATFYVNAASWMYLAACACRRSPCPSW